MGTYISFSLVNSFVGPCPVLGSVNSGYAPSPDIVQTHSDNTIPTYNRMRKIKKVGLMYQILYNNDRSL